MRAGERQAGNPGGGGVGGRSLQEKSDWINVADISNLKKSWCRSKLRMTLKTISKALPPSATLFSLQPPIPSRKDAALTLPGRRGAQNKEVSASP